MKVLFCSPYSSAPDVVKGGLNVWGKNIMTYYASHPQANLELVGVSFDRHTQSADDAQGLYVIWKGIIELARPTLTAVRAMRKQRPDAMHICSVARLGLLRDLVLLAAARIYGVRSVLHLHFGRAPELKQANTMEWKLLKLATRWATTVLTMNQPSYEALNALGIGHIDYLPNPLSEDVICQAEDCAANYEHQTGRLLFVGHAFPTKGVVELVEGCKGIDGIELRLVGKVDKEMAEKLRSIAGGDWLTLVGEMPHEQVLQEFAQADMLVFPSYSEGFPYVVLEAMVSRCPIVASRVGAIPDMLTVDSEEPCGICIEPKSAEAVRKAVTAMLADGEQKHAMAERGYERVKREFAMPVVWNRLVEIWKYSK